MKTCAPPLPSYSPHMATAPQSPGWPSVLPGTSGHIPTSSLRVLISPVGADGSGRGPPAREMICGASGLPSYGSDPSKAPDTKTRC